MITRASKFLHAVAGLCLVCLGSGAQAASILSNPGFEIEYPAGQASNWWVYGGAGRASWAARTGSAGLSFHAAGNAYGGFGQDVGVDLARGNVFRFDISGKAETNYTNENTTMAIEFCCYGSVNYVITQQVYGALSADRNSWVFLSLSHTNTDPSINIVRVRCDYADGLIPPGAVSATCQWDDGRLYQGTASQVSEPSMAIHEPVSGVYLGVLLERGGTLAQIQELNQKANKPHAVYAKFLLFAQDDFPWDWVRMIQSNSPGAGIHFILEPMVGFTNFYAADWGAGQETYEAAREFATNCAAVGTPIFLRFAHEANGDWYPWHPEFSTRYGLPDTVSNETYIAGFRNFADLVHSNAPNVAMVWGPNQGNGPDPMPFYEDVYPGDAYVDWVGMSVYNGWSYGNSNEVLDFQFRNAIQQGYWQENDDPYDDTFEDFYWTFSDPDNPAGHHKPMMIAETAAAFEPKYIVSNEVLIAGFESLDGPQFTASGTLAQFQDLNSDGWTSTNHSWVDGFDDLSTWNWGPWGTNGYTWTNAAAWVEGAGALLIQGRPEAGGVYMGGNGRTLDSISFAPAKTMAEFQDLNSDGLGLGNSSSVDPFENLASWNWGPWGNLFWSNSADCVEGTNAAHMGGTPNPGEAYVGGNGRTYDPDWSMYNGMQIWARCDTATNVNPILVLGLRSGSGPGSSTATATASRAITSGTYAPVKVFFTNMTVSPGFSWSNIWDFTVEVISSEAGSRPGDLWIDNWTKGTLTNSSVVDQDWWPEGPLCTPWGDGADLSGGTHTWTRVSDPAAGLLTNSLRLSGTDGNTNSYIGGNGFSTRPEDRDWSGSSHLALMARRAAGSDADPMVRIELIDGAAKTSGATLAVGGTTYSRLLMAVTNMATDAGFAWTNVMTVKLHFLTSTSGVTPADLYIKQFQLGTASTNRTPADWSAFNGMELSVRRGGGSAPDPLLAIGIRSLAGDVTATAAVQTVVTHTNYHTVRIPFSAMSLSPGFTWTNITTLVLESFTTQTNVECAPLAVDNWRLVNLTAAPYADQDWWPPGSNDICWDDDTDSGGGWMTWSLVPEPVDGYPTGALRMAGFDANSNYYIGGNGFSLAPGAQDWSDATFLAFVARRSDMTNAEPLLSVSLRDSSNTRTAQVSVVIVPTNYMPILVPLSDAVVSPGFDWGHVSAVVFEMLSGSAGRPCSDLYLKEFAVGTASNVNEQDWLTAGTGYQPWGDSSWSQTTDAAAGTYALQISGLITNASQWYIGGNGCAMPISQQDWSDSAALVLYGKKGDIPGYVQPKFKITIDNDYAETNGNEAVIETKVANTGWYEMIIGFEDFIADPGFAWTNVKMVKIELFTGEGGKQPNDLYIDHLRRAAITLTNGADNIKWKRDWCDQLYSLENFDDADPADPDEHPDYVSILENFRNVHMINWFHVKKFEDGFTKDLKIAEDGTNGVVYESYYNRIRDSYFLTNVVVDTDGDRISDEWESLYFDGPTNANPGGDWDDDGQSEWNEYVSGTHPKEPDSYLQVDALASTPGSGGLSISWPSKTGRVYRLERSEDLSAGFVVLSATIQATPPLNTYTDAVVGQGPFFYRISLRP